MSENSSPTGTVEGLIDFCDFLIDKGYATVAAVNPWKSAVKQVFAMVEGDDDYGSVDVRSIDLDEYLRRFEMKARGKLKVESVAAYRQRATRAIESYRAYADDSGSWRPPRFRGTKRADAADQPKPRTNAKPETNGNGGSSHESNGATSALIDFPFPLRSGQMAHLRLPLKLEKDDAERLAAHIRTLVSEPQLELPEKAGTTN
jgi:hypothetical protein